MKNTHLLGNKIIFDNYRHNALRTIGNFFSLAVFSLLFLTFTTLSIFAQATGKIAFQVNNRNIYTMNADGTMRTALTFNTTSGRASTPTWSPDGSRLAFECNNGICIINADGTGLTMIPNTSNFPDAGDPSWSPDGNRIAYTHYLDNIQASVIFVINVNGSNLTQITSGDDSFPSWSPDGSKLVFSREGEF